MMVGRMIPIAARPPYSSGPTLSVVLGAQADCFSGEAVETLVRGRYTVSQHADRMGYHLQGPLLVHAGTPDIVSDATPQGALQVPGNQQPILLMADRQTTGGYPKIGVVITADLPLAAQLVPGDTIGFALIDVSEAQAIAREQRSRIEVACPNGKRLLGQVEMRAFCLAHCLDPSSICSCRHDANRTIFLTYTFYPPHDPEKDRQVRVCGARVWPRP